MLTRKLSQRGLILAIALISVAGFGFFTNAEFNFAVKAYGLLFTCQLGFLIFFLNQILRKQQR